jgi:hypothetical protein
LADSDTGNDDSFKALGAKWLFSQSVPTVLLVLLICCGFYGAKVLVPEHLHQIQEGYERVAGDLSKTSDKFDKEQERTFLLLNRMQDRLDGRKLEGK